MAPRSLAAALVLLVASPAGATYSITAYDTLTGEMGGAGASCVPYEVDLIYGVVVGRGVLNAQASFDEDAKILALERLLGGDTAPEVLAAVTDPSRFPDSSEMQWGIVDVAGTVATYTGTDAQPYAGDLSGRSADSRFVYSVQGNLLTSRAVLEQARDAFEGGGCDLAERLMLALEAAAMNGGGDNRCTPENRPSNSAYLDVTRSDGAALHVSVPDVSPLDPTLEVRRQYEAFRDAEPCPALPQGRDDSPATKDAGGAGCSLSVGQAPRSWQLVPILLSLAAFLSVRRLRRR